jgi:hypothetical protein
LTESDDGQNSEDDDDGQESNHRDAVITRRATQREISSHPFDAQGTNGTFVIPKLPRYEYVPNRIDSSIVDGCAQTRDLGEGCVFFPSSTAAQAVG